MVNPEQGQEGQSKIAYVGHIPDHELTFAYKAAGELGIRIVLTVGPGQDMFLSSVNRLVTVPQGSTGLELSYNPEELDLSRFWDVFFEYKDGKADSSEDARPVAADQPDLGGGWESEG